MHWCGVLVRLTWYDMMIWDDIGISSISLTGIALRFWMLKYDVQ